MNTNEINKLQTQLENKTAQLEWMISRVQKQATTIASLRSQINRESSISLFKRSILRLAQEIKYSVKRKYNRIRDIILFIKGEYDEYY